MSESADADKTPPGPRSELRKHHWVRIPSAKGGRISHSPHHTLDAPRFRNAGRGVFPVFLEAHVQAGATTLDYVGMRYTVCLNPRPVILFGSTLPESTVTEKFQVTIPKEVREEIDLRPGERVVVEKRDADTIVVRRYRRVREPLKHLIGKKRYHRRVSLEELEEKIESR